LKAADADSKGVVLIYHEHRKFAPYLLLESLKKYHLLERFSKTVVSFADGYKMAEAKCTSTIQHFTLRDLAKLLLNREETAKECFDGSACYRARLAFEIAYHLANDEFQEEADAAVKEQKVATFIRGYAPGLEKEFDDIAVQEQNLMRQNSLRPLFLEYFKTTLYHRVKAVTYRRILAEQGYDFEALKTIWFEKNKVR
jgi:maternal protein exuperantia